MESRPTVLASDLSMTGFLDGALELLSTCPWATALRLYFYAVTTSGWDELSARVADWLAEDQNRAASAFVGTDHGLTDPDAVGAMRGSGVTTYLMRHYKGTFHPKMVWVCADDGRGAVLVGSNNLTYSALHRNVEFALLGRHDTWDTSLEAWHAAVAAGAVLADDDAVESYRRERRAFQRRLATANLTQAFVWSKRTSGTYAASTGESQDSEVARVGDLILEVMPRETGTDGRQVQVPMAAASSFFLLGDEAGASKSIRLEYLGVPTSARVLTLARYSNRTSRLAIRELDYSDRPCVLCFRSVPDGFQFEIVSESTDPTRYRSLLAACHARVGGTGRRWIHVT